MKVLLRRVQFLTLCYKTLTIKVSFRFHSSTNLSHNSSFLLFKECLLLLIDLWSQETIMPPTGLITKVAGFASLPHIKAPPLYRECQCTLCQNSSGTSSCVFTDLHDVDFLSLWEVEDFFGSWANYFVILTNRKQRLEKNEIRR